MPRAGRPSKQTNAAQPQDRRHAHVTVTDTNTTPRPTPHAPRLTIHDSLNVTAPMATLAAHDQENAVRSLQVGPGGKPLGAKTPGNKAPKTPFKVPLNDENVFTRGGKGDGKGNLLMTTTKGGKLDASAFVTPAGRL